MTMHIFRLGSLIRATNSDRIFFSGPQNPGVYRQNMSLFSSDDGGDTWQLQQTIYPGNAGYSSLQCLHNGSVAIMYEQSDTARAVMLPDRIFFQGIGGVEC